MYARLHAERGEVRLAREAARAISGEPLDDVRASDAMSIPELAAALGVRRVLQSPPRRRRRTRRPALGDRRERRGLMYWMGSHPAETMRRRAAW
ncbi:hypothetical protein [Actinomadura monticuli]|uniref:Uncharacterized protein n=1 Tax=Actinomadura monticuli TaxID=3097367 RepID=A0ABV4Q7A8_9ACTN